MINSDNYITIQQAAKLLNVHWQTIRNYIKSGDLKSIKLGRTVRIPINEIKTFNNLESEKLHHEIELRYVLKNRDEIEDKLRKLGARLTNHSHIIDTYFVPNNVKSLADKDVWFECSTGHSTRIREVDNDYSGHVTTTLEIKKLAGPDYKDHSNVIEAEIAVVDYKSTNDLLTLLGYKNFLVIDKERFVYRIGEIKFCFDTIKDWGEGLEIEIKTARDVDATKKEIRTWAKKLGLFDKDLAHNSFTYMAMETMARFN